MVEAMNFHKLSGKKWAAFMNSADEEAEAIMERMREQSLLTDVSEQVRSLGYIWLHLCVALTLLVAGPDQAEHHREAAS